MKIPLPSAPHEMLFLGRDTFCVLAGNKNIKVNAIIKRQEHDVVKIDWLLRCQHQAQFIPWYSDSFCIFL